MKLESAYLCEDCQEVAESDGHGRCGVCGSPALLNLARILNRNPQEEILNFAPRVSARITDEEVVLCIASDSHGKHAAQPLMVDETTRRIVHVCVVSEGERQAAAQPGLTPTSGPRDSYGYTKIRGGKNRYAYDFYGAELVCFDGDAF